MKPRLEYIICADKVLLEEGTGKAIAVGIFNEIKLPKKGITILAFAIYARLIDLKKAGGDLERLKIDIVLQLPNGDTFHKVTVEGIRPPEKLNLRGLFGDVIFDEKSEEGRYPIKIFADGTEVESSFNYGIDVSRS